MTKNPYGKCYIISTGNDQRPGQHMLYAKEWSVRSVFSTFTRRLCYSLCWLEVSRRMSELVWILWALCAAQPGPHKIKPLVLSPKAVPSIHFTTLWLVCPFVALPHPSSLTPRTAFLSLILQFFFLNCNWGSPADFAARHKGLGWISHLVFSLPVPLFYWQEIWDPIVNSPEILWLSLTFYLQGSPHPPTLYPPGASLRCPK